MFESETNLKTTILIKLKKQYFAHMKFKIIKRKICKLIQKKI